MNNKMQNYQDYQSSDGQPIQMCAIHELYPLDERSYAMSTVGGLAVCKEHLAKVAQALIDDYTILDIIKDAIDGQEGIMRNEVF